MVVLLGMKICVLDRTSEYGSIGEPLYLDVSTSLHARGDTRPVLAGIYGIAGALSLMKRFQIGCQ